MTTQRNYKRKSQVTSLGGKKLVRASGGFAHAHETRHHHARAKALSGGKGRRRVLP